MASKYQLDFVRSRIVERIEADWPTTLRNWDEQEDLYMTIRRMAPSSRFGLRCSPPEPAAAIALAKRFGIRKILPAAFYELSRRTLYNNKRYKYTGGPRQARGDILSVDDYQTLIDFQVCLHTRIRDLLFGTFDPDCSNNDCRKAMEAAATDLRLQAFHEFDFIRVTRKVDWSTYGNLCNACMAFAIEELKRTREDTWDNFT